MRDDRTIARLAAANPLPGGATLDDPARERLLARVLLSAPARRRPSRRLVAVGVAAAAIAVPAAAFADQIGQLLGFSNEGTPVATTAVVGQDGMLASVMAELQFPSQIGDLGERAGFHFYVSRKADGDFCFVISSPAPVDAQHPRAIGCAPPDVFPTAERPLIDFSGAGVPNRFPADGVVTRLLGFAADGVASVAVLDANGDTIASTPVVGNVYADTDVPQVPAAAIVARDASGAELYRIG